MAVRPDDIRAACDADAGVLTVALSAGERGARTDGASADPDTAD